MGRPGYGVLPGGATRRAAPSLVTRVDVDVDVVDVVDVEVPAR
jgi:hypothetical protein